MQQLQRWDDKTKFHPDDDQNLNLRIITHGSSRISKSKHLMRLQPTIPPLIDEALEKDHRTIRRCAEGIQLMRKVMQNKRMQNYV